ncbi:MAG: DUF1684 domain-containing protein [Gemmatimonadota bacterium]
MGQSSLERERADFAHWFESAPNSPLRIVIQQPVGSGITIGPADSDVPLTGQPASRILESDGALSLTTGSASHPLPRNRLLPLGRYTLFLGGERGRTVLSVFGAPHAAKAPAWYPPDSSFVLHGELLAAGTPRRVRVLSFDGIEVTGTDAGEFVTTIAGHGARLRVYRLPDPDSGEDDLLIYFRDATSGQSTYPAGRFVPVIRGSNAGYVVDLNRARNPFCAYSTAYACPAPWPGNTIESPITAGERYEVAR